MNTCNRCDQNIDDLVTYFEMEVTAKKLGRPIPFIFRYCTSTCMFDDMRFRIRPVIKEDDTEWKNIVFDAVIN